MFALLDNAGDSDDEEIHISSTNIAIASEPPTPLDFAHEKTKMDYAMMVSEVDSLSKKHSSLDDLKRLIADTEKMIHEGSAYMDTLIGRCNDISTSNSFGGKLRHNTLQDIPSNVSSESLLTKPQRSFSSSTSTITKLPPIKDAISIPIVPTPPPVGVESLDSKVLNSSTMSQSTSSGSDTFSIGNKGSQQFRRLVVPGAGISTLGLQKPNRFGNVNSARNSTISSRVGTNLNITSSSINNNTSTSGAIAEIKMVSSTFRNLEEAL